MLWAALPGEVANSVVLGCMEEAKQLVDKAYKERRERWEYQAPAGWGKVCRKEEGTGEAGPALSGPSQGHSLKVVASLPAHPAP